MRSSRSTGLFASGLAFGAAALGLAVIFRPGVAIPFTVEWIMLFGTTAWLISRERDRDVRRWLMRLVFGALGVRLLLAVPIHFGIVLTPYFFAPDALTYETVAVQIADWWGGTAPEPTRYTGAKAGYYYLSAFFYVLFGESSFALVVLNMFAGVWTVLLVFSMTKGMLGLRAAKGTALLTAFFPSLVLWSVLNIRDSLATLLVVLMVWAAVRLRESFRPRDLVIFAAALLLLTTIRDYMAFLVLAGLAIGSFAAVRPDRMFASMATGSVVALFLTYVAGQMELFTTLNPEAVLGTAQSMREAMQTGAGSAFGVGASTTTVGSSLQYLPLGAAFLLFAPFPWAVESMLQTAALPETLLWYPLFLLSVVGMYTAARTGRMHKLMIPFSVLVIVTLSYALVEGNFGTAYRHRAQIMPLFFLFTGMGLNKFSDKLLRGTPWARRARAAEMRTRERVGAGPKRRL